jgi:hypothetical protein
MELTIQVDRAYPFSAFNLFSEYMYKHLVAPHVDYGPARIKQSGNLEERPAEVDAIDVEHTYASLHDSQSRSHT